MSHLHERHEKICLNCNAEIYGRYCHVCGQENIEPKDKFWHLVTHFVYDIIHFDGKFFSTSKFLLFRPGYLSLEYMRGRRADFLHPIRMYVFVSAFFFLLFLSFFQKHDEGEDNGSASEIQAAADYNGDASAKSVIKYLEEKRSGLVQARNVEMLPEKTKKKLDKKIAEADSDIVRVQRDSIYKSKILAAQLDNDDDERYKTIAEYEAAQAKKKPDDRDNWLEQSITKKNIALHRRYTTSESRNEYLREKFWHSLPQLLFISLPFVALVLQLLYIRERKQIYYVNHVIYTVHLYCAVFILLFLTFVLGAIQDSAQWLHWFWMLKTCVWLYMVYYLYQSLRTFYKQGAGKTIAKMILLGFLTMITMSVLFAVGAIIFYMML